MNSLLEKPVLTTSGSGNEGMPPDDKPMRNGDGDAEGPFIAGSLQEIEAFANRTNLVNVSGLHMADTLRGVGRHQLQRSRFSVPTGRLTTQNVVLPIHLN